MPDPTLHGNGYNCPACELRRAAAREKSALGVAYVTCNHCNNTGRIAFTEQEAYALQLADAHKHHWGLPDNNTLTP